MNTARKQAVRNTYNIIYNVNVNNAYNTPNIETSIRTVIEETKLQNNLHELDERFLEWKINKKSVETTEMCPVCYEPIQSNNYIIPKCGHKLCLHCYKQCILSNGECANKCCLCKETIL